MTTHQFSDDYTGPRYTYALTLRPFSSFNIPSNAKLLIGSQKNHFAFRYGTFQTSEPISSEDIEHFNLIQL